MFSLFLPQGDVGMMTLSMELFKTDSYIDSYWIDDYPVHGNFSKNIYIQYAVNTTCADVMVRAVSCRATPTNKPYDTPQFVFITHG